MGISRTGWLRAAPDTDVHYKAYHADGFGPANSLAFALDEGRSAVLSPVAEPADEDFAQAEALGEVTALIAPNFGHLSGLPAWTARYPKAQIFAPRAACDLAAKAGKRAFRPLCEVSVPQGTELSEAPGARTGGTFLRARGARRPIVYLDEVLITMTSRPEGWLSRQAFRFKGVRPGLAVNRVYTDLLASDRRSLAEAALALLRDDPFCLVAHGPPITAKDDLAAARAQLRALAG